jgi:hypothetical protein
LFAQALEAQWDSAAPDSRELVSARAAALDHLAAESVAASLAASARLRQWYRRKQCWREPQFELKYETELTSDEELLKHNCFQFPLRVVGKERNILANEGPPQQDVTTLPVIGQFHKMSRVFRHIY